jgi:hypothetical protein
VSAGTQTRQCGLVLLGVAGLLAAASGSAAAAGTHAAATPAGFVGSLRSHHHATGAGGRIGAANLATISDPTGDVTDANGNLVQQPHADLIAASGLDDATTVTLTAQLAVYSNPSSDSAWQSSFTGIAWEIDTTVPGSAEYTVAVTGPGGVVTVFDKNLHPVCSGTFTGMPNSATYQVAIAASCIGSPGFFRFAAYSSYDTNSADTTGASAVADIAPDSALDAVPEGEPGVVAGGTGSPVQGYWLFSADGEVFNHGTAGFYGSVASLNLNQPIISAVGTPSGRGYWLVGSDGGVFAFGDAGFYGSTGNLKLNSPVVSLIPTVSGHGYWLVASDGGIFSFGDAVFHGSTGGLKLNEPVLGGAATATGQGYWLVAADGGIFAFGDAAFHGSTGGLRINRPVVGMARTGDGGGYWLVASDGGIFAFGDAAFYGSTGSLRLNAPVVDIVATPSGHGYRMVGADGGLFSFGDAEFDGSEAGSGLGDIFVAAAPAPPAA